MIWVDALQAVLDALEADVELLEALEGANIYRNGEHNEYQVPGIYWTQFSDIREENTEPFSVQLDLFAKDFDQLIAMESRVRAILHRDVPQTLGEIKMWTQQTDARDHAYPSNDAVHRSLDFRFEPARENAGIS